MRRKMPQSPLQQTADTPYSVFMRPASSGRAVFYFLIPLFSFAAGECAL